MRKKYRIKLPKDKEIASIVSATIIDGDVIIGVEQMENIRPKDGDFLVSRKAGIFIYKPSIFKGICLSYIDINPHEVILDNPHGPGISSYWSSIEDCRYATEQEKKDFLERIKKELHKEWDPEAKILKEIIWYPKKGERYYYIDSLGNVLPTVHGGMTVDKLFIEIGNCFQTEDEAKPYADKIKELFKSSK